MFQCKEIHKDHLSISMKREAHYSSNYLEQNEEFLCIVTSKNRENSSLQECMSNLPHNINEEDDKTIIICIFKEE